MFPYGTQVQQHHLHLAPKWIDSIFCAFGSEACFGNFGLEVVICWFRAETSVTRRCQAAYSSWCPVVFSGCLGFRVYSINSSLNTGESNGKENGKFNGNWYYIGDYKGHSLDS